VKGIVLAGGSGTRLRPFSYSGPKQLMPIANRPTLGYVLDTISALGVTEVGIVVGDQAAAVAAVVGDGSDFAVRVTYLRQDRPAGLAHAVTVSRPFLGDDDFIMVLGDNVFADGLADHAAAFRRHRPAAQVVVHKVLDPRPFGVAELHPDGTLRRLVEKPQQPRSNLATLGAYFFTAAVHDAAEAITPSRRGELEISDAIQWLVDRGDPVHAREYTGYWKDVGTVDDALDCNRHLLARLERSVSGQVCPQSRIEGTVRLAPDARIVRSTVAGPVVIGAGALVEDCVVGPYTSIGDRSEVRGSQIRDSLVLDDARVTGVPDLESSIVGRGAVVGRRERAGHRLVVGDHTQVDLAGPPCWA
jgi:glucose-1-phosphate thymidylyltransferase